MHGTRRALSLLSGVAFAVTAVFGATGAQADKVVWNVNIFGPKRAVTAGIEKQKEMLEAASGGQLELSINYGDALGPRKQNPENVKIGAFEVGVMCVGYYPNKYPLLSVLELPFLLPRDIRARSKVEMAVHAHPAIKAEMADRWNSKFLSPAILPAYEFMGNKRIETVEDMQGVKMRISGLNAKALQEFGAVPTMVTAPDGYNALDRGTIDSFGFPYSYAFGAYKLFEVSKYVTEGLAMSGFLCFYAVNNEAYEKAPQAAKDVLAESQKQAIEAMISAYEEADKKWIPIFHEKLEVVKIAPATRDKLAASANRIWDEWAKEQDAAGRPGTEILNFVKDQVQKTTM